MQGNAPLALPEIPEAAELKPPPLNPEARRWVPKNAVAVEQEDSLQEIAGVEKWIEKIPHIVTYGLHDPGKGACRHPGYLYRSNLESTWKGAGLTDGCVALLEYKRATYATASLAIARGS
jgi:hypothetical protein